MGKGGYWHYLDMQDAQRELDQFESSMAARELSELEMRVEMSGAKNYASFDVRILPNTAS